MPVIRGDVFERLLGSLDRDELTAFVAELWAARGWETSRDGPVVVAQGGPGGREQRLVCVPRRRWRQRPALADCDPDVVVAARRTTSLVSAAHDAGARFVGPEELRELALYGIDRDTADRLFENHLGRPVATEAAEGRRLPAAGRASTAVALAAALVLVAAVGGFLGVPGALGVNDGPAATATPIEAVTTTAGDKAAAGDTYPPGVDRTGVVDADDLADAHARFVSNRTYDLLVRHRGSVDLINPERRWASNRQTVDRVSPDRFHYRVAGFDVGPDGNRTLVVYDDYADGSFAYRRVADPVSPTYQRGLLPMAGGDGPFTALAAAYLERYLATADSSVAPLPGAGEGWYRLTATGSPERLPFAVDNYSAVAVVHERGFVSQLVVDYTRLDGDGVVDQVHFELRYRRVGEATAARPPWYDRAVAGTNETLVLRSPDSLWWTQPVGIDYREEE